MNDGKKPVETSERRAPMEVDPWPEAVDGEALLDD